MKSKGLWCLSLCLSSGSFSHQLGHPATSPIRNCVSWKGQAFLLPLRCVCSYLDRTLRYKAVFLLLIPSLCLPFCLSPPHWLSLPEVHLCFHRQAQWAFVSLEVQVVPTTLQLMKWMLPFSLVSSLGENLTWKHCLRRLLLSHHGWVGRTLVQRGIPCLLHQTSLSGGFRIYPPFNRQAHHLSQIRVLWMLGGLAFNSCEF